VQEQLHVYSRNKKQMSGQLHTLVFAAGVTVRATNRMEGSVGRRHEMDNLRRRRRRRRRRKEKKKKKKKKEKKKKPEVIFRNGFILNQTVNEKGFTLSTGHEGP
jgi:hypothetical protein